MGLLLVWRFVALAILVKINTAYESTFLPSKDYLRVETSLGPLYGTLDHSVSGVLFWKFRGIPYALPPTGELRFEESLPYNISYGEKRELSNNYPSHCLAFDHFTYHEAYWTGERAYGVSGEEDCLFLNVHTPSTVGKRTVIFFIHGGGFGFGSPSHFDAHYVMDKDIVYVNIAYRLGPLGFLSTGDSVVPGNMGLKDQLLALQWVKNNIALFGGDPEHISLSGMSAGGASVHFMYLSPLTKDLFKNGYSYSGSALCPWAMWEDIPEKTKKLATVVNCTVSSSRAMVDCLKNVDPKTLVGAMAEFKVFFFNPFTIFGPVVDNHSPRPFMPRHPEELLKKGSFQDKPWLSGFTAEGGLYPAAEFIYSEKYLEELMGQKNHYLPHILYYNPNCAGNIGDRIWEFLHEYKTKNGRSFVSSFLQLITDRLYTIPALKSAAYMARKNVANVHLYYFMYRGVKSISENLRHPLDPPDIYGVCQGDDVAYVYDIFGFAMRENEQDRKMSAELIDLAVQFANTSSLPATFEKWEKVTGDMKSFEYLKISGPNKYKPYSKPSDFMGFLDELLGDCRN